MKSTPAHSAKLAVFEGAKTILSGDGARSLTAPELFICGGLGGVAAHSASFPLEVIKTKLAGSPTGTYSGIADCVRKTYSASGIRGFYVGLIPALVSTIPHAGTSLSTYQLTKDLLCDLRKVEHPDAVVLLSAASISTVAGTTVSTPMHVIKTRLILGTPNQGGAMQLIRSTWAKEGWAGFFRGFQPSVVKGIPAHIVSFGTFEFFRRVLGIEGKKKHKEH